MIHTFRPDHRDTIRSTLVGLLFLGILLFLLMRVKLWLGILILFALFMVRFWREILPVYRTWIEINPTSLSGHIDKHIFSFPWIDIACIQRIRNYLRLTTDTEDLLIPLGRFTKDDIEQVWLLIRDHVNPATLAEQAYEHSGYHRAWLKKREALVNGECVTLRLPFPHWTGWILPLITTAGCIGISLWIRQQSFSEIAWFFIGGAVMVDVIYLFSFGQFEIDSHSIRQSKWWQKREARWEDISQIRPSGFGTPIFYVGGKHAGLNDLWIWRGETGQKMRELVRAQIEVRNIPVDYGANQDTLARKVYLQEKSSDDEKAARAKLLTETTYPLRFGASWGAKAVAIFLMLIAFAMIVFILVNAVSSIPNLASIFSSEEGIVTIFVRLFGMLVIGLSIVVAVLFSLSTFETIVVDSETLAKENVFSRDAFTWSEIVAIEYGLGQNEQATFVFHKQSVQKLNVSTRSWPKHSTAYFKEYILAQAERLNIPIHLLGSTDPTSP